MRRALAFLPGAVLLSLVAASAGAQSPGPAPVPEHMPPHHEAMGRPEMDARAAQRFPQPVRAGTLLGRALLQPVEWQPILGRVAGLARGADGATALVVGLDGRFGLGWLGLRGLEWSGIGPRQVAVPVGAVALLGEHVALMGLTPEQLRALPTFRSDATAPVGPDETLRVGIVRPFH